MTDKDIISLCPKAFQPIWKRSPIVFTGFIFFVFYFLFCLYLFDFSVSKIVIGFSNMKPVLIAMVTWKDFFNWNFNSIFSGLAQTLGMAFLGTFLGIGLALMALYFRAPIMSFYAQITGNELNFLGIYDVYALPVHYLLSDFIIVTCFAVIISTLAGLVPALRAALLNPADALRSE